MNVICISWPETFHRFNRKLAGFHEIRFPVDRHRSIKDIIESLGVPHTEVGAIIADGRQVGFDYFPVDSRKVMVAPITAPFDVTRPSLLRPAPLEEIRFIVDVNVGKLAMLLRALGLDTAYGNDCPDAEIARRAEAEGRIVLTKDTAMLKRRNIHFGRYVRGVQPDDQLAEVVAFFGLKGPFRVFSRCLRCNQLLTPVEKQEIVHRLEPKTRRYYHDFRICHRCDNIYWKGSHYEEILRRLSGAGVLASSVE